MILPAYSVAISANFTTQAETGRRWNWKYHSKQKPTYLTRSTTLWIIFLDFRYSLLIPLNRNERCAMGSEAKEYTLMVTSSERVRAMVDIHSDVIKSVGNSDTNC